MSANRAIDSDNNFDELAEISESNTSNNQKLRLERRRRIEELHEEKRLYNELNYF